MLDKFVTALVELLKVKTIVTLVLVFTTCYLMLKGSVSTDVFMALVGSVITYYFTKKEDNKDE